MKTIRVVAAVICDPPDKKQKIFATARGYGEFKGQWEFPGGKVEPGETSQQALVREIQEELATKIRVGDLITTVEYLVRSGRRRIETVRGGRRSVAYERQTLQRKMAAGGCNFDCGN